MTQERELGWEETITEEGGGDFVLLPAGDYNFTVEKFERTRYAGSSKLPPCNQAKLEIKIHSNQGDVTVFHNLFLHTKTEGLLSNFFIGIGQKKKGEPLRMNWPAVVGAKGRCKLSHYKYSKDGRDLVVNQIDKFYPHDEYLKYAGNQQPQQQGNWQSGQF